MKILQPFEGNLHITAPFGQDRTDPDIWGERLSNFYKNLGTCCHMGVDLRAKWIPLRAGVAGTVIGTSDHSTGGQFDKSVWVRIQADEPHEGGYIVVGCFHMSERIVEAGDRVEPHTNIGTSGASGNVMAHLHFGVRHINKKLTVSTYEELANPNTWMNPEHRGHIDPMPLFVESLDTDMRHVITPHDNNQYLLDDNLKVAFTIADIGTLREFEERGLGSSPEHMDNLDGYEIYHGNFTNRWKNFLNIA